MQTKQNKPSFKPFSLILLALCISACTFISPTRYFALNATPSKTTRKANTELANNARQNFWQHFHNADYQALPKLISQLTAAYLETPTDPSLARLLGLAHLWQISESSRQTNPDARVTESAILAEKYFSQALELEPTDNRLLGFLGVTKLVLGSIQADPKQSTDGYLTIQDGIAVYPEFNLFVLSAGLGRLPAKDERFNEAVESIWRNYEVCIEDKISRNPSLENFNNQTMRFIEKVNKGKLSELARRGCTNTNIAPHNLEGFFLQWGDLLVKQGRNEIARMAYEQAKLIPEYMAWPYKNNLEQRLQNLNASKTSTWPEPVASDSSVSCMVCHQN